MMTKALRQSTLRTHNIVNALLETWKVSGTMDRKNFLWFHRLGCTLSVDTCAGPQEV